MFAVYAVAYRNDKWAANEGDHAPVESQEAHTKSSLVSEQLIDNNVIGSNPADPIKDTKSGKNISGEPEPDKTAKHDEKEETLSGHVLCLALPVAFVQCVEERRVDECSRPDHRGGPDEELANKTGESIAD